MQRVKTSKKAKTDMEKIQAENLKSVFFPIFFLEIRRKIYKNRTSLSKVSSCKPGTLFATL